MLSLAQCIIFTLLDHSAKCEFFSQKTCLSINSTWKLWFHRPSLTDCSSYDDLMVFLFRLRTPLCSPYQNVSTQELWSDIIVPRYQITQIAKIGNENDKLKTEAHSIINRYYFTMMNFKFNIIFHIEHN